MSIVIVTAVSQTYDLDVRCDGCGRKTHVGGIQHLSAHGTFNTDDVLRRMGWGIMNRTIPSPVYAFKSIPRTDRYCPPCAAKRKICTHADRPHPIWHSADGDIPVCTMTPEHLANAVRFAEDMVRSDSNKIRRALDHMHESVDKLKVLQAEVKRRG